MSTANSGGQKSSMRFSEWLQSVETVVYRRRPLLHAVVYLGAVGLSKPADLTNIVAAVVVVVGALVRIWASSYIRKNVELATEGPYAVVRHPLYLANLVIFGGIALAANNILATAFIAVTVGLVYWLTIRYEERYLRGQFGAAYDDYAARVPALVPFLAQIRAKLRAGNVLPQRSRALTIGGVLLFIAVFELKEEWLEHYLGTEFSTVWGVAIPAIINSL